MPIVRVRTIPADPASPLKERALDAADGEDLLEVLQRNGYPVPTACGGIASCGLCRVTVVEGREHLTPIRSHEITHLGTVAKVVGLRLACQAKVTGPVVVSLTETEDVEQRKRRKAARIRAERVRGESREPRSARDPLPSSPRRPPLGAREEARESIEWRPRILDPKDK